MLYTPSVVGLATDVDKDKFDKKIFDASIEWIYRQERYDPQMLEAEPMVSLIQETNKILSEAYRLGIADNVIPEAMDAKLRQSVFLFSACKTHQELSEASQMLRTQDGLIKPFSQFATEVTKVHSDYNVNYLRAEYDFAVSSSQMAARWAEVEQDGDSYNLQYRTADDPNVRESHRVLHNITLPPSDPFWDQYFPPNAWGCRCNAIQVRKTKYEISDPQKAADDGLKATTQISGGVDKGAIFRFNSGKTRQIFPPKHPYYKMTQGTEKVIANLVGNTNKIDLNDVIKGGNVTDQNLKEVMRLYADKFQNNYNGGLIGVEIKRTGSAFMSNGRYPHREGNVLTIHNHNFTTATNGVRFNPAAQVKGALQAIRTGNKLSFTQEYAMESLWHETLHAKARGWVDRSLRNDRTVRQMETINQFVARHTYPQFIESFGGKATNQQQVLERGYGYGSSVRNFRKLLKHHKIGETEVVGALSDKLISEPYEHIGASAIRFLESRGVKNAAECMSSIDAAEKSFLNLLNPNQ